MCKCVCVRWSRPWESREWISDDTREKANLKALIPLDSLPLPFGSLVCPLHWRWLTAPTPATTGLKGWIKVTEAQWGWTVKQRENNGKKVRKNIEDEDGGGERMSGKEHSSAFFWPTTAVEEVREHLPWPNANLVPGLLLMRRNLWVISEINDLVSGYNALRARHRPLCVCLHGCVWVGESMTERNSERGDRENKSWVLARQLMDHPVNYNLLLSGFL